jgi:hypothetical protein
MTIRSWANRVLVAGVAGGLVACQTVAADADQSAIISTPNEASRAALQLAVNTALNTDVTLADDALTDTDLLVIERTPPQSIAGSPAGGRTMDAPIQFRLVINGGECVLVDQRDGTRYPLANTGCTATN